MQSRAWAGIVCLFQSPFGDFLFCKENAERLRQKCCHLSTVGFSPRLGIFYFVRTCWIRFRLKKRAQKFQSPFGDFLFCKNLLGRRIPIYADTQFQSPFGDFLFCKSGKSSGKVCLAAMFQSPFGDFLFCKWMKTEKGWGPNGSFQSPFGDFLFCKKVTFSMCTFFASFQSPFGDFLFCKGMIHHANLA